MDTMARNTYRHTRNYGQAALSLFGFAFANPRPVALSLRSDRTTADKGHLYAVLKLTYSTVLSTGLQLLLSAKRYPKMCDLITQKYIFSWNYHDGKKRGICY